MWVYRVYGGTSSGREGRRGPSGQGRETQLVLEGGSPPRLPVWDDRDVGTSTHTTPDVRLQVRLQSWSTFLSPRGRVLTRVNEVYWRAFLGLSVGWFGTRPGV